MDYWTLLLLIALYYFTIFGPRVGERSLAVLVLELGSFESEKHTPAKEHTGFLASPLYFHHRYRSASYITCLFFNIPLTANTINVPVKFTYIKSLYINAQIMYLNINLNGL